MKIVFKIFILLCIFANTWATGYGVPPLVPTREEHRGLAKVILYIGVVIIINTGFAGSNHNGGSDALPAIVFPETGGVSVPWQRYIRLRTSPMEVGPMAGRFVISLCWSASGRGAWYADSHSDPPPAGGVSNPVYKPA